MDKDFITVSPSEGGQGVTKLSVQAAINEGGSRSTFITITGGGITKTIPISQEASPTNVSIVGGKGNIIKTTIM